MERKQSDNISGAIFPVILLFATMAGMLTGCGKDGGVCVSNSGEITKQVRNVADFNQVNLNDNVSLILTSDNSGSLVVEAGRNILGGISTTVENGQLTIGNNNTCNWLRDYSKPINVYVASNRLWKIKYNGSGDISTSGTLKLDSIAVEVWGGCGTIDLSLDVWQGSFSLNMGTVDFRLRGVSAITSVYTGDYGLYDGRNLKTGYTFITTKGSNDAYVWAINSLNANIQSIGNIYYTGNPATITTSISGTGKVIPL
jgi:hypothetical protein